MNFLISWLIRRMGYVYSFITRDLHLPSTVGYGVILILIIVFFYDLFHLYRNRHKGYEVLLWLLVILLVPLGTLLYYFIGRRRLDQTTSPVPKNITKAQLVQYTKANKTIPTTLGTIIAIIAWTAGSIAVVFFIIVGIALIRCANDPKCM